jgi:hypothetical protein
MKPELIDALLSFGFFLLAIFGIYSLFDSIRNIFK